MCLQRRKLSHMLLHFIVFHPFRIATIHFEGKVWSVQKNWQQLFVKSINTIKTRPSLSSLSLMLLMLKWSFIWLQSVHIPSYIVNENWKPFLMILILLYWAWVLNTFNRTNLKRRFLFMVCKEQYNKFSNRVFPIWILAWYEIIQ